MREIAEFAREMAAAAVEAPAELHAVGEIIGKSTQDMARSLISGHAHLPAYPRSITYDVYDTPLSMQVHVGPDKGKRQGPLGNIIEYGTSKNAPLPHLNPAFQANQEKFELLCSQIVDDLL